MWCWENAPITNLARSDAPFSKTAPASFDSFGSLKTVAENLAGAVFENGASDRALMLHQTLSRFGDKLYARKIPSIVSRVAVAMRNTY